MTSFVRLCVCVLVLVCFAQESDGYMRVCYYTNWSQYREEPGKFFPEDITDPTICTHMVFAFSKFEGKIMAPYEWNDMLGQPNGLYARLYALKQLSPALKTLLAIGGWNLGSDPFTQMVASDTDIDNFVSTSIAFLRANEFDGLDLDWEYPANRGSPAGDRERFTVLCKKLRDGFDAETVPAGKERLLLAAAVAAGKSTIDTAYNVEAFMPYMDFVSIMAYDLHGSWENVTGINSPLYSRTGETGDDLYLNMDWAAKYWVHLGAQIDKLVIGMGMYGRTFTLADPNVNGLGAPAVGPGIKGQYTGEEGFVSQYEICDMLNTGGTRVWDDEHKVPYLYKGDQWVGYDDKQSLELKVQYVMDNGFAGVMIWAIDLDDFYGTACSDGVYPLLSNIKSVLLQQQPATTTLAPCSTTLAPNEDPDEGPIPDTFTCDGRSDDYYAHKECNKYYFCLDNIDYEYVCPEGLLWDVTQTVCNWPSEVTCAKRK